jgi:ferredoxin/coenzyme F420-reducing hydrogenase delta subunit
MTTTTKGATVPPEDFAAFPYIFRGRAVAPSFVSTEKCIGCSACFKDCPYQAIEMHSRTDGRPYKLVAWVNPDRCMSCGVCNGSCDSDANNLPSFPIVTLENLVKGWSAEARSGHRDRLLLICREVTPPGLSEATLPGFRIHEVPCAGSINMGNVKVALESGFKQVHIATSLPGSCIYREGDHWIRERVSGARAPTGDLTAEESRRVRLAAYGRHEGAKLLSDLAGEPT